MTDYNDGKWHAWNGGECPVHPKTHGEFVFADGTILREKTAGEWLWNDKHLPIVAFRVTKPYTDPKEYSGTCYAYHYTNLEPTLVQSNVGSCIKGKWTATHIDGKLAKITWDATE
jgi:hypothetical protein